MKTDNNNHVYDKLAETWWNGKKFFAFAQSHGESLAGAVFRKRSGEKNGHKNPLSTFWDIQQQKRGRITFAELGQRLELNWIKICPPIIWDTQVSHRVIF